MFDQPRVSNKVLGANLQEQAPAKKKNEMRVIISMVKQTES